MINYFSEKMYYSYLFHYDACRVLTLMTNALMKAAGSLILYLLVTRQPPMMVAALLAKVN